MRVGTGEAERGREKQGEEEEKDEAVTARCVDRGVDVWELMEEERVAEEADETEEERVDEQKSVGRKEKEEGEEEERALKREAMVSASWRGCSST